MLAEFFSIGDRSSEIEIGLQECLYLSLFQFLIDVVCQEVCIPKSCQFNAIQGLHGP